MSLNYHEKIVFIHGSAFSVVGAEINLIAIACQLAQRKYHPVVVCPSASPTQQKLASCGIETRTAPFPEWRKWKTFFARRRSIKMLESIIDSVKPRIIHVNSPSWLPQILLASRRFTIPIMVHVHLNIERHTGMKYKLHQADHVIAVSNETRHSLEVDVGVPPHQITTLYNSLDLNRFSRYAGGHNVRQALGLSSDDIILGTVANLSSWRGYDVMLDAMPIIHEKFPRTHYLMIGHSNKAYEQQLRSQVQRLCLEGYVHFLGFQHDVLPYLEAFDVYIQPSRVEALSVSILEAMAMSKPVIGTEIGGTPEVVKHGHTGLLVKSDDAHALAQAALALLSDPERRRVFGANGRQRVETQFNVEGKVDELIHIYRDILQTRQ